MDYASFSFSLFSSSILKIGHADADQQVVPGHYFFDVRYVYPFAVVLGQYGCKELFQLFGRCFRADGLFACGVFVDVFEYLRQRQVVRFGVNRDLRPMALTLAEPDALLRLPSVSDSTITPFLLWATNLNSPLWPDMARTSFKFMVFVMFGLIIRTFPRGGGQMYSFCRTFHRRNP